MLVDQKLREQVFIRRIHVYAFAYIFDQRASRLLKWIRLLKIFGLVVPATIGAVALSYRYEVLEVFIFIAIPATIIQFIFSIFAIVYEWDNELAYAYEASRAHSSLYIRYNKMLQSDLTTDSAQIDYDLTDVEFSERSMQDFKHNIKEWELRKGHRFSLREHQHPCKGCGETPTSMNPTDCDVCGKFPTKLIKPSYERQVRKTEVPIRNS